MEGSFVSAVVLLLLMLVALRMVFPTPDGSYGIASL